MIAALAALADMKAEMTVVALAEMMMTIADTVAALADTAVALPVADMTAALVDTVVTLPVAEMTVLAEMMAALAMLPAVLAAPL
ncbi:hypothetical protein J3F80_005299, partial [Coemansia sp. RSA 2526]